MRRKFKLHNETQQHIAIVFFFYEEQLRSYVGLITTSDLSHYVTWLYQHDNIPEVIVDLAQRLPIKYNDYIEAE